MMQVRLRLSAVFMLVLFFVVGCETTHYAPQPVPQQSQQRLNQQDPQHVATAKRFLNNIGAGQVMLDVTLAEFDSMALKQPGLADLAQRSFADVTVDDFEMMAAPVYARHLSHENLAELEQLTQKPELKRFFATVFSAHRSEMPFDEEALMQQFNADELIGIMKFSMSESFQNMHKMAPKINHDLARAAAAFGEATMRDYVSQQ